MKKMGFAKLNVWVRDLKCELAKKAGVTVVDCHGRVIETASWGDLPRELQVPPGCYIVRAHACYFGHGGSLKNYQSDRSMVIVRCGEEACVNLVIPEFVNCAKDIVQPLIAQAIELRMHPQKIKELVGTLGEIARIPVEEFIKKIDLRTNDLRYAEEEDVKNHVIELKKLKELIR
ncbi:MAG: hypothetical protein EF812_02135 [Methanosarcinales archaeon]|nr:MAG: hypothetical protein EF812_02135 [Methanosarcinales archaeon]